MNDDCLLKLYQECLISEARQVFDALSILKSSTMEGIMIKGRLSTQQVRKGVWGLASTGLIIYQPGRPVEISANGMRLAELLKTSEEGTLL